MSENKENVSPVKRILPALCALSALLAVVSTTMLAHVWCRVRAFDRAHGCDVMAGVVTNTPVAAKSQAADSARGVKPNVDGKCETETNRVVEVRSIASVYDETQGTVEIAFSKMPKIDDLRRAIQVTPKVSDVSIETESRYEWRWSGTYHYVTLYSKQFKFRQPYTITIARDLKFDDGYALDKEYEKKVERADIRPSVSMAHSGRYLPAVGNHVLAIDCVNVSRIDCSAWRVLPENIVQLLAREERQYTKSLGYWHDSVDGDSDATTELSTAPYEWTEQPLNKLNEREKVPVVLQLDNGIVSNGVYLLAVGDGDAKRSQWQRRYDEYRLVCVTDIGLSVRRDNCGLRVWVTSLSTGKPMANVTLTLYAANRLVLCERKTDAKGEVTLDGWDTRYTPFALVATDDKRMDATFMAIRESMEVGENLPSGRRPDYLEPEQCRAFVWTERGIYRHDEKIMTHIILRNGAGNAPKPFPIVVELRDAEDRVVTTANGLTDAYGAMNVDSFTAPASMPSGKWKIKVLLPGKDGKVLGEREIKIEEFVPPQVRVKLRNLPTSKANVTNITYTVAAEQLFGGPAKAITAESLVSFTDVDFAPKGWEGFRFGDVTRGLTPNYTRLDRVFTDDKGEATFTIGMQSHWGEPKSAVRLIIQGAVFETGGRPSVTRESCVIHKYPYYIGSNIPRYIRQAPGTREVVVVQVNPDGTAHGTPRTLKVALSKIEYVYNLVQNRNTNDYRWDSQRVKRPVGIDATLAIGADGKGKIAVPTTGSGDYELSVTDEALGLSHIVPFWISSDGDDEVRASLKDPTSVAISTDKALYREGDKPRVTLKCPFRGYAWLSVLREKTLYTRVVEVTNLTQVVELDAVDGAWAPNIDVAVSLVQAIVAGKDHQAIRAHGIASLKIRTRDSEIPVKIAAKVACASTGGSEVAVRVEARGETASVQQQGWGERAVITVVDEGINLLTNEKVPDPIGYFSVERGGWRPLYDVFGRLLPVLGEGLRTSGVKTGGDDLAGMMNRVSPVPTRRFKPLSQWQFDVPLTNGVGAAVFRLPEFVGEVRITAFVYNARGTGCNAVHQKVCPKLVMQPDAPRFVAPGDMFYLTLSLFNRSGKKGDETISYEVTAKGAVALSEPAKGTIVLADDGSQVLRFQAVAKDEIGQGVVTCRAQGVGETHVGTMELPVRPAVAWQERANVILLRPGETIVSSNAAGATAKMTRRTFSVSGSPIAELKSAYDYLAEYPYGCLEQTTSRMFPLLYGIGEKEEALSIVKAGVARVASMLRENDFTMWPDCNCAPWDREVSLYAAHFLVEAGAMPDLKVSEATTKKVCALLKKWAYDADTNVSVYACHTLALAGRPEKERLYTLYDRRDKLSLLSRARLARAFVRMGEPKRARELVADAALDPHDVREAAFALMTLLEMDAKDVRLPKLVLWLQSHRDKQRHCWGTTGENAHALLALGAYYRATGVREGVAKVTIEDTREDSKRTTTSLSVGEKKTIVGGSEVALKNVGSGDAYVWVRELVLPEPKTVTSQHNIINVSRTFKTSEGLDADMSNLTRGELLIGEIVLSSDRDYDFSDLIVQELLPACLEPDRKEVADAYNRAHGVGSTSWVLRSDVRDDRVLVFSKPVGIYKGQDEKLRCVFRYAVRVITPGQFVLPGTRVEAMYAPEIEAHLAPETLCVKP